MLYPQEKKNKIRAILFLQAQTGGKTTKSKDKISTLSIKPTGKDWHYLYLRFFFLFILQIMPNFAHLITD